MQRTSLLMAAFALCAVGFVPSTAGLAFYSTSGGSPACSGGLDWPDPGVPVLVLPVFEPTRTGVAEWLGSAWHFQGWCSLPGGGGGETEPEPGTPTEPPSNPPAGEPEPGP